jgi:probable lipoprotein NlpC
MRFITPHACRPARPLIAGLIALALFSGCASSQPPAPAVSTSPADATTTEQQLRSAVDTWYGTPYDFGGTSAAGIDCSAFVQVLYRDVLGLPVPRTTRQQAQTGRAVSSDQVHQPGDLVFFRPQRKQRHVGVYLGDGEFAHASESQGVMISRLQEPYWEDAYWMTRRLLPNASSPAGRPPATPPSSRRTGW